MGRGQSRKFSQSNVRILLKNFPKILIAAGVVRYAFDKTRTEKKLFLAPKLIFFDIISCNLAIT